MNNPTARNQQKRVSNRVTVKNHQKAFKDGWQQLLQTPLSTFITCTVIAMTIFLASILFISVETFQKFARSLHTSNQVTIYLKPNQNESELNNWVAQLKQSDLLAQTTYVSPEQALRELVQDNDLKDLLNNNSENPLPAVLLLKFTEQDKQQIQDFVNTIKSNSLVESVHFNNEWFERVFALLDLGKRLTYLLMTIFGIGIFFIISHTIQGATTKNQKEMSLLQLIGASQSYIRRPFLYLGAFLGLGGGVIALFLLGCLLFAIQTPLNSLTHPNFALTLRLNDILVILLTSTLLGWVSAIFAFYTAKMAGKVVENISTLA